MDPNLRPDQQAFIDSLRSPVTAQIEGPNLRPDQQTAQIKDPNLRPDQQAFIDSLRSPTVAISPQIKEESQGLSLSDIPKAAIRSAMRIPESAGYIAETLGAEGIGKSLKEFGKPESEYLKPDLKNTDTFARKSVVQGIESIAESLGPSLLGTMAGGAIGGAIATSPTGPGALIGGGVGAALGALSWYGLSTYGRKTEEALKKGLSKEDTHNLALEHAFIEGGIEAAAAPLELFTMGGFKVLRQLSKPGVKMVTGALKKTLLEELAGAPFEKGLVPFVKAYAKTAPIEVGTEMIQEGLGTAADVKYGISKENPFEQAKEVIGPTLISTLLMTGGMHKLNSYLADREVAKANNLPPPPPPPPVDLSQFIDTLTGVQRPNAKTEGDITGEALKDIPLKPRSEDIAEQVRAQTILKNVHDAVEKNNGSIEDTINIFSTMFSNPTAENRLVLRDIIMNQYADPEHEIALASANMTAPKKEKDVLQNGALFLEKQPIMDKSLANDWLTRLKNTPMYEWSEIDTDFINRTVAAPDAPFVDLWKKLPKTAEFPVNGSRSIDTLRELLAPNETLVDNPNTTLYTQKEKVNLISHVGEDTGPSVKIMVTNEDIKDLKLLSYSDKQIKKMAPQTMAEILQNEGDTLTKIRAETGPVGSKLPKLGPQAHVLGVAKGRLVSVSERIETAPSEAQKKAGNYAMDHKTFQGIPITIETPQGVERTGTDINGKPWSAVMPHDYGYIKGVVGNDKNQLDATVGPNTASKKVFVITQNSLQSGGFDEHKVMLGFNSGQEAKESYNASFSNSIIPQQTFGHISSMSIKDFKEMIKNKTLPKILNIRNKNFNIAPSLTMDEYIQQLSNKIKEKQPLKEEKGQINKSILNNLQELIHSISAPNLKLNVINESNLNAFINNKDYGFAQHGVTEGDIIGQHRKEYNLTLQKLVTVIDLATNIDSVSFVDTVLHEPWHNIEELLLTSEERAIIKKDFPINYKEESAKAFSKYMQGELGLISKSTKTIFDRIKNILIKIKNWADGHGYKSTEDIFYRASTGELKTTAIKSGVYQKNINKITKPYAAQIEKRSAPDFIKSKFQEGVERGNITKEGQVIFHGVKVFPNDLIIKRSLQNSVERKNQLNETLTQLNQPSLKSESILKQIDQIKNKILEQDQIMADFVVANIDYKQKINAEKEILNIGDNQFALAWSGAKRSVIDKLNADNTMRIWILSLNDNTVKKLTTKETTIEVAKDEVKTIINGLKINEKSNLKDFIANYVKRNEQHPNADVQNAINGYKKSPEKAVISLNNQIDRNKNENIKTWIDYLTHENELYVQDVFFQNLALGALKDELSPLTPSIGLPLQKAALSATYDYYKQKKDIIPFKPLYEQLSKKYAIEENSVFEDDTGGKWVKFDKTNERSKEFKKTVADLQAISPSTWYTKEGMAEVYIQQGDFYAYVDNKGKTQIAVRLKGDTVEEIQGIQNNGVIPFQYFEKIEDLTKNINVSDKVKQDIEKAKGKALMYSNLIQTYGQPKKLENGTIIFEAQGGDFILGNIQIAFKEEGTIITGSQNKNHHYSRAIKYIDTDESVYIHEGVSAPNLEYVGGNAFIYEEASVPNLKYVGRDMGIYKGVSAPNLEYVGGNAFIHEEALAPNLKGVSGYIQIYRGASVPNLEYVDGYADIHEGASALNLKYIGGNVSILKGASVPNLEHVNGSANIYEGASAPNLKYAGGDVHLHEGALVPNLEYVGKNTSILEGADAPNLKYVGEDVYLYEGALVPNLKFISGNAYLREGASVPNLKYAGEDVHIQKGASAPNLEYVGGYIYERESLVPNSKYQEYAEVKKALEQEYAEVKKALEQEYAEVKQTFEQKTLEQKINTEKEVLSIGENQFALAPKNPIEEQNLFNLNKPNIFSDLYTNEYIQKAVNEWKGKILLKTDPSLITSKDIDLKTSARLLSLPWYIAKEHPEFRNILNIELNREESREETYRMLTHNADNTDLNKFLTLPNDQAEELFQKVIVEADKRNERFTEPELLQLEMNTAQIAAYKDYNTAMDRAWHTLTAAIKNMTLMPYKDKSWFGALIEIYETKSSKLEDFKNTMADSEFKELTRVYTKLKPQLDTIHDLRKEMGRMKAFMPRIRPEGEWVIKVMDDKGNTLHSERTTSANQAAVLKQKLMKDPQWQNKKIIDALEKSTPESIFQSISDASLEQFMAKATSKLVTHEKITEEQGDDLREALIDVLVDTLKARGFGRHMVQRFTSHVITGYKTSNGKEIFHDYLKGMAGFITKQHASFEMYKALSTIDTAKKPQLFEESHQYIKDLLRNTTSLDRISGGLRATAFAVYLAGNLKSAFMQFTQNFVTGIPFLSQYTKNADLKYMKAMNDVTFNKLTLDEKEALSHAIDKGITAAQYAHEIMGHLKKNTTSQTMWSIIDLLAKPFQAMEIWNRKSAFLVMYRVMKTEKKMSPELTASLARDFVYDTHYLMGKANLPSWARGGQAWNAGARTLYTFRSFNHNFILSLYHAFKQGVGLKVIGRSLAYLAAFGGLFALPGGGDLLDELEKKLGIPFKHNMRKGLNGLGGIYLEKLGVAGIPGLFGVDLSGSLAIGLPKIPGQDDFSDTVLGVWGGIADKFIKSMDAASKGDGLVAFEKAMPVFVENAVKAYRLSTRGMTTSAGKLLFDKNNKPVKFTEPEALSQTLSFKTERIGEIQTERRSLSNIEEKWGTQRNGLYERYRLAKTPTEQLSVVEKIRQYNQSVKQFKGVIPFITTNTLKRALKSAPDKDFLAFSRL